jgi:hypothetical protein
LRLSSHQFSNVSERKLFDGQRSAKKKPRQECQRGQLFDGSDSAQVI